MAKSLVYVIINNMDNNKLEMYRHSASHIMAQAVKHLFPEAKLGIGPGN